VRQAQGGRLADAASGNFLFADVDQAAQKCAGGEHNRRCRDVAAVDQPDPGHAPAPDDQVVGFGFNHIEIRRGADRVLHRPRVELAVGLGAGAAHGRALAAVEQAELDAARIGNAAHQSVQSVDFPDQVAFAKAADGRIAGHGADGGESMGHQGGSGAHASSRSRGFAAGVATTDDEDIEGIHGGRFNVGARSGQRKQPLSQCFT
jgi:hypothetical protein